MIWLYLINHILEAAELYYYTFCLYPHIRRKRQEFLALFASYTVLFSIFIFFENYNLNILCNIVIITFLLKYITPAGILDSIKHSLLTIMTVIISELLFDIPTVLFHIDTSFPYPNLGTLLIGTLIIHIIHIVIMLFLVRFQKKHISPDVDSTNIFTISVLSLCTLSLIGLENLGFLSVLTAPQIPWVYAILLSVLFTGIASLLIFLKYEKEHRDKAQLQSHIQRTADEKNYNHMIMQLDNDQKILIHDIRNHLQTIRDLLDKKEYSSAGQHLSEMLDSSAISGGVPITNNYSLNLILARYKTLCAKQDIQLSTDIKGVDIRFLTSGDVTSLFCNLLDNAMEASVSCSKKEIHLRIASREPSEAIQIILVNSCETEPAKSPNGTYLSGKADAKRHGFGLQSIRRVIEKYHGDFQSYYDEESREFHTIILIYPEVTQ